MGLRKALRIDETTEFICWLILCLWQALHQFLDECVNEMWAVLHLKKLESSELEINKQVLCWKESRHANLNEVEVTIWLLAWLKDLGCSLRGCRQWPRFECSRSWRSCKGHFRAYWKDSIFVVKVEEYQLRLGSQDWLWYGHWYWQFQTSLSYILTRSPFFEEQALMCRFLAWKAMMKEDWVLQSSGPSSVQRVFLPLRYHPRNFQ